MPISISIVIVSWNCKRLVLDCLASLRAQFTPELVEIILVDNASTDGTPEAVRQYYPCVVVIRNPDNFGFARANNIGIDAAKGKYVCLINPDVVVLDKCIARMYDYMESHVRVGMLGPVILGANGAIQRSCMRRPTLWNQFCRAVGLDSVTSSSRMFGGFLMKDFQFDEIRDVDVINGCFWMVRREALDCVGVLDPQFWMYGDDLDWCERYHLAGWKVTFFPQASAIHYGGGTTENAPIFFYVEMHRANLQYWRKYHNVFSYCCYWLILNIAHGIRSLAFGALYLFKWSDRPQVLSKLKRHAACLLWLITSKEFPIENI